MFRKNDNNKFSYIVLPPSLLQRMGIGEENIFLIETLHRLNTGDNEALQVITNLISNKLNRIDIDGYLEDIDKVFILGAKKYGVGNHSLANSIPELNRIIDAYMRHRYYYKEEVDKESGLSHEVHEIACLLMAESCCHRLGGI